MPAYYRHEFSKMIKDNKNYAALEPEGSKKAYKSIYQ